jgi:general secretion pathway protein N
MTGWATPMRLQGAFAGLLGIILIWELLPAAPPAPQPVYAGRPALPLADDSGADSAGWLAQILARPLFRADRRPLAAMPAASVNATPPRLTAIVITAAGRSAIFVNADGSASVLAVGGSSGAYVVQAITPDSARLSGPDGVVTLHPEYSGGVDASAPAPVAVTGGHPRDDQ